MQFGVFSVSDITRDPVTGQTPSEAERIDAIQQIARKTEEVGMDVFAIGEHHNPPFFSSSPTTLLAAIAATTKRSRRDHVDDADHHQRPGSRRRRIRDAPTHFEGPDGSDDRPRQHRPGVSVVRSGHPPGLPLALQNYDLLHRLWREDVVDWEGEFRTPLKGFTSVPRPLDGVPPFVWHGSIRTRRSPSRLRSTVTATSPITSSGRRSIPGS